MELEEEVIQDDELRELIEKSVEQGRDHTKMLLTIHAPEQLVVPEEFREFEKFFQYLAIKPIGDGKSKRYVALYRLMHTTAITAGSLTNLTSFDDRWCYHNITDAVNAYIDWDGKEGTEPNGWHRHPNSGRRRDPETGKEWINP